jgi:hypothetical protein
MTWSTTRRKLAGWSMPMLNPSHARASHHSTSLSATVVGEPTNSPLRRTRVASTACRSVHPLSWARWVISLARV